jgi:hypothetical protein
MSGKALGEIADEHKWNDTGQLSNLDDVSGYTYPVWMMQLLIQ